MKRCKHEYTAYKYDCDDLPDPLELEYMECLDCGAWLPLGPSSDDSPEVACEIAAAQLAADQGGPFGYDRFDYCPTNKSASLCVLCQSYYLAHAISSHATTEGE